jgi:NADPH2:quinone reductase
MNHNPTSKAVVLEHYGDASHLLWKDSPLSPPLDHEVRIRHEAVGLNFIDIYQRNGLYPLPLPTILGSEGVGIVLACGKNVHKILPDLSIGDRVAYGNDLGAYCEERNINAEKLLKLPDPIPSDTAACLMLRGLTAEYLIHRTFQVKEHDTVLWHAAAGGLAQIAIPWLKSKNVTVIGTVGAEHKKETALAFGCDHVFSSRESFSQKIRELVPNGLPVVYDSIGADSFEESLKCLQPRGMMVSFGNASGPVSNVNLGILASHGSLFLTRPTLAAYTATRQELELSASRLFNFLASHPSVMKIHQRFSLRDVQTAHRALEERKTTGLTVLIP